MFTEGGGDFFGSTMNFFIFVIVMMIAIWLWVKFIESKIGKILKHKTFDKIMVRFDKLPFSIRTIVSKISFFVYVVAVFSILFYFQT